MSFQAWHGWRGSWHWDGLLSFWMGRWIGHFSILGKTAQNTKYSWHSLSDINLLVFALHLHTSIGIHGFPYQDLG
jgi:hypothetical protein